MILTKQDKTDVEDIVLRVVTVQMLVEKTAALWRSFHDQGTARAVREAHRTLRFEVTGYPDLPERMRETIVGWLGQAVELTGAQNVRVVKFDDDPELWTWTVTWR